MKLRMESPNAREAKALPSPETKNPPGQAPRRVREKPEKQRLEVQARSKAEDPRRLQLGNLVGGGQRETGHVALQDRVAVDHIESVNRQGESQVVIEAEVLRQTEVDLDRIRQPESRHVAVGEREDVVPR